MRLFSRGARALPIILLPLVAVAGCGSSADEAEGSDEPVATASSSVTATPSADPSSGSGSSAQSAGSGTGSAADAVWGEPVSGAQYGDLQAAGRATRESVTTTTTIEAVGVTSTSTSVASITDPFVTSTTATVNQGGQEILTEIVTLSATEVYGRVSLVDGWFALDSESDELFGIDLSTLGTLDPNQVPEFLRDVVLEPVGPEQIDGTDTVHYRAVVPLSEFDPAELGLDLGAADPATALSGDATVDYWITPDWLTVKSSTLFAEPVNTTSTATFLYSDEPAAVTAPPADQVRPIEELRAALGA